MPTLHIEFDATGGTLFEIRYKPSSGTVWQTQNVTGSPVDISVPTNEPYDYCIKKICSPNNNSIEICGTAVYIPPCATPEFTFDSRVGNNFAFNYLLVGAQPQFDIEITAPLGGGTTITRYQSAANPTPLHIIIPNIQTGLYRFRMRGVCGVDVNSAVSNWSAYVDVDIVVNSCQAPSAILLDNCVLPNLISVVKINGANQINYTWEIFGFDYQNGNVILQYSLDNGTNWNDCVETVLSNSLNGTGTIQNATIGQNILYRIICNGNGCNNQISNVISSIYEDIPMEALLTRVSNVLLLEITGGIAPYTYSFGVSISGSLCADSTIDDPDGTTSNLTAQTTFSYQNNYTGGVYDYSVIVTDSSGATVTSNIITIGACLVYGTKVITKSSQKNIEDLLSGDFILDINKSYTEVKSVEYSEVDRVFDINNGLLVSSEWHIHIIKCNGVNIEKQTIDLKNGDKLINKNNVEIEIISIQIINEKTRVVNLSTESGTYIANNILTHNKNQCPL